MTHKPESWSNSKGFDLTQLDSILFGPDLICVLERVLFQRNRMYQCCQSFLFTLFTHPWTAETVWSECGPWKVVPFIQGQLGPASFICSSGHSCFIRSLCLFQTRLCILLLCQERSLVGPQIWCNGYKMKHLIKGVCESNIVSVTTICQNGGNIITAAALCSDHWHFQSSTALFMNVIILTRMGATFAASFGNVDYATFSCGGVRYSTDELSGRVICRV